MRETENDLCSSISRASLRAISTGRTSDLKARLNVPSTRPAILLSMLLSMLIERPGCGLPHVTEPGRWILSTHAPGSRNRTIDHASSTSAPAVAPTTSAEVVGSRCLSGPVPPAWMIVIATIHRRDGGDGPQHHAHGVDDHRAAADQIRHQQRRQRPRGRAEQQTGMDVRGEQVMHRRRPASRARRSGPARAGWVRRGHAGGARAAIRPPRRPAATASPTRPAPLVATASGPVRPAPATLPARPAGPTRPSAGAAAASGHAVGVTGIATIGTAAAIASTSASPSWPWIAVVAQANATVASHPSRGSSSVTAAASSA